MIFSKYNTPLVNPEKLQKLARKKKKKKKKKGQEPNDGNIYFLS